MLVTTVGALLLAVTLPTLAGDIPSSPDGTVRAVAEAKQKLAAITDEEIQQGSMQAMMMIGMVEGVLTELETVETAEEFEQAIQAVVGPFLGGMMGAGEDMYDDTEYSDDAESE